MLGKITKKLLRWDSQTGNILLLVLRVLSPLTRAFTQDAASPGVASSKYPNPQSSSEFLVASSTQRGRQCHGGEWPRKQCFTPSNLPEQELVSHLAVLASPGDGDALCASEEEPGQKIQFSSGSLCHLVCVQCILHVSWLLSFYYYYFFISACWTSLRVWETSACFFINKTPPFLCWQILTLAPIHLFTHILSLNTER